MNKQLQTVYVIVSFTSSMLFISNLDLTFNDRVNRPLNVKYFLIWIATLSILYSLYKTNQYVNKYILPLLLFLNVGILLVISLHNNKLTHIHILSMIGIVYLLLTYKYKDFEIKNASLVQANESWIYQYIFILGLWFVSSSYLHDTSKIICCLLVVYPIFFPMEEYFIHRSVSLVAVYLVLNAPLKLKSL